MTFYTALYHTMMDPNIFQDVDGKYFGMDRKIHTAKGFTNYTVFSLWDIFRAELPLMTIIEPKRDEDFVRSLIEEYRQDGLLPIWPLAGNETYTMIGYPAVPVIFDAYMKGLMDFNVDTAFAAMKHSAELNWQGLRYYQERGYIPADKLDSLFNAPTELAGREDPDITGMIGQDAQGDEQSHHIGYLYDYAGEPWKTQYIVRKIMSKLYTDKVDGLCG
ncbi:MAG: glycoside hydrolase family 92 protein, partial [Bacteroidetes bacterium]|nr:glycoside hydrolase family 92 protein [Bacteroidota bacterium]